MDWLIISFLGIILFGLVALRIARRNVARRDAELKALREANDAFAKSLADAAARRRARELVERTRDAWRPFTRAQHRPWPFPAPRPPSAQRASAPPPDWRYDRSSVLNDDDCERAWAASFPPHVGRLSPEPSFTSSQDGEFGGAGAAGSWDRAEPPVPRELAANLDPPKPSPSPEPSPPADPS